MYKKVNVVMLPTNEKAHFGDIILNPDTKNLFIFQHQNCTEVAQHLYFTSDEEIKGGDWCLNSYDNQIWKYKPSPCPLPYWGNKDTLTKIIASDTSLISINEKYFDVNKSRKSAVLEQKTLPQIPQQFIEKWIEEYNKGNVIKKVEVEYNPPYLNPEYNKESLKINLDNTINIKSIKNSWSREELCDLLSEYEYDKGIIDWKNFIPKFCSEINYPIAKEWI